MGKARRPDLLVGVGLFLALASLGACASSREAEIVREVPLGPQTIRPAVISFPSPLDVNGLTINQDEGDLARLLKGALQLVQTHPAEARRLFLEVAEKAPGSTLAMSALAAAAMTHLNAGDRDGFLEMHARLEETLAHSRHIAPPPEVADLLSLGRHMKGDRSVTGASPRLRELLNDLERSR